MLVRIEDQAMSQDPLSIYPNKFYQARHLVDANLFNLYFID